MSTKYWQLEIHVWSLCLVLNIRPLQSVLSPRGLLALQGQGIPAWSYKSVLCLKIRPPFSVIPPLPHLLAGHRKHSNRKEYCLCTLFKNKASVKQNTASVLLTPHPPGGYRLSRTYSSGICCSKIRPPNAVWKFNLQMQFEDMASVCS